MEQYSEEILNDSNVKEEEICNLEIHFTIFRGFDEIQKEVQLLKNNRKAGVIDIIVEHIKLVGPMLIKRYGQ